MIGDEPLAKQLNIEKSDILKQPKDFYSFLAWKLKEKFIDTRNEIIRNTNHVLKDKLDSFERLAKLDIHRSLIKIPIMTKPYNVSSFQMIEYLKNNFIFTKINNINKDDYIKVKNNEDNVNGYYIYKENKEIFLTAQDFNVLSEYINKII